MSELSAALVMLPIAYGDATLEDLELQDARKTLATPAVLDPTSLSVLALLGDEVAQVVLRALPGSQIAQATLEDADRGVRTGAASDVRYVDSRRMPAAGSPIRMGLYQRPRRSETHYAPGPASALPGGLLPIVSADVAMVIQPLSGRREHWMEGARVVFVMAAAMWVVEVVDSLDGHRLDRDGIVPRSVSHLYGIVFAPLLHASFGHLIANHSPCLPGLRLRLGRRATRVRRPAAAARCSLARHGGASRAHTRASLSA